MNRMVSKKLQSLLIGVTVALATWRIIAPVERCAVHLERGLVTLTRRWMPWDVACPRAGSISVTVDLAATVFQFAVLIGLAVVVWMVLPRGEPPGLVARPITGTRVPTKSRAEGDVAEMTSASTPQEISLETARLADLGSRKTFNRDLNDLISDFERNAGGFPVALYDSLVEVGRAVEMLAAPSPRRKPGQ